MVINLVIKMAQSIKRKRKKIKKQKKMKIKRNILTVTAIIVVRNDIMLKIVMLKIIKKR